MIDTLGLDCEKFAPRLDWSFLAIAHLPLASGQFKLSYKIAMFNIKVSFDTP